MRTSEHEWVEHEHGWIHKRQKNEPGDEEDAEAVHAAEYQSGGLVCKTGDSVALFKND